jgi:hypothetical protein
MYLTSPFAQGAYLRFTGKGRHLDTLSFTVVKPQGNRLSIKYEAIKG